MTISLSIEQIITSTDSSLGVKTRKVRELVLDDDEEDNQRLTIGFIVAGQPPEPRYVYKTVEKRTEQWSKLVGVLFCAPASNSGEKEILPNLDYFHHRSGVFVDFFCVGYEQKNPTDVDNVAKKIVATLKENRWTFDAAAFNSCRKQIEEATSWQYSGETELLLVVARKEEGSPAYLDYTSVVACNLEAMCKDEAITSIRAFFEKIFQFGEKYKGKDPVWKLSDQLGISVGGDLLREAVLLLLPDTVQTKYKAAKHFVVSNVSKYT